MNLLNIFDFKEKWDHIFYKTIIKSQSQGRPKMEKGDDFDKIDDILQYDLFEKSENLISKGLNSCIDPKYTSYLSDE